MSASLVGSEMCIRDSKIESHEASTLQGAIPAHFRRKSFGPHTPDEMAVSYTHLTLPTICSV
eukprot:12444940-Alexandrium_andersonii.AAC.1